MKLGWCTKNVVIEFGKYVNEYLNDVEKTCELLLIVMDKVDTKYNNTYRRKMLRMRELLIIEGIDNIPFKMYSDVDR